MKVKVYNNNVHLYNHIIVILLTFVNHYFGFLKGIGSIPDACLSKLMDHRDLGIHTEMFSDGVVALVERGAVTNAFKKVLPGRIVGSFIIGTKKVMDFIDANPFVGKLLSHLVWYEVKKQLF
mgnify:CR=1 FL=1